MWRHVLRTYLGNPLKCFALPPDIRWGTRHTTDTTCSRGRRSDGNSSTVPGLAEHIQHLGKLVANTEYVIHGRLPPLLTSREAYCVLRPASTYPRSDSYGGSIFPMPPLPYTQSRSRHWGSRLFAGPGIVAGRSEIPFPVLPTGRHSGTDSYPN